MSGVNGVTKSVDTGPLLTLRNVSRSFVTGRDFLGRVQQSVRAVDHVSIDVDPGTTLGIVGESGSGKSTLGRLALRMIESDAGEIAFSGKDVRRLSPKDLRQLRPQMTMIFQDPYSALNPRWTVGRSIAEPLRINGSSTREETHSAVVDMLARVGLDADAMHRRPAAFSGGQRQRIVIARALVTRPRLVFCDEPVSALDVSTRAQVIGLLEDLQRDLGLTYLFVSHDLGIVESVSDRIAVMYLGSVVEIGNAETVARQFRHPYTASLVSAVPAPDPRAQRARRRIVLNGDPPSPVDPPSGCTFHPRCPLAEPICAREKPPLLIDAAGHGVACHVTQRHTDLIGVNLLARMTDAQEPGVSTTLQAPPTAPESAPASASMP
jgi:oligopeptide/dipeptide ABC transporter ATP-binding protein